MMKKLKCLLLAAVCFFAGSFAACRLTLRQDLVRIHVVANSDGERDQSLKLRVRDAVLAELENVSRENLEAALTGLRETAQTVLRRNGDDSAVAVSLGRERFARTTSIDGVSLPAGSYETLRLTIGDGAGRNWWGVLFPKLIGGSSTTYFKSAFYGSSSAGVRCPWRFASLSTGGFAGLAAEHGNYAPGNSNWSSRPRLCGAGKKRGEWSA